MKINGKENIVIEIKLKEYVPIKDRICIELIEETQLKEIKFHGKPVKTLPLINSIIEKINEKISIDVIFLFTFILYSKVTNRP